jgi:hypothetical protein
MRKIILLKLFILAFYLNDSNAQTCLHRNLSHKFNYKIEVTKAKDSSATIDHGKVYLKIYDKHNKLLQTIYFECPFLYMDAYKHCSSVRSYITGYNKNKEVPDYDFGDFIVADLNFDGKEDLAIKYDSGGNGGPFYRFYMQGRNGLFKLDHFLTDSVGSFPAFIEFKYKTITTQIHADVGHEAQKTFKYDSKTKKWRLIKWILVTN